LCRPRCAAPGQRVMACPPGLVRGMRQPLQRWVVGWVGGWVGGRARHSEAAPCSSAAVDTLDASPATGSGMGPHEAAPFKRRGVMALCMRGLRGRGSRSVHLRAAEAPRQCAARPWELRLCGACSRALAWSRARQARNRSCAGVCGQLLCTARRAKHVQLQCRSCATSVQGHRYVALHCLEQGGGRAVRLYFEFGLRVGNFCVCFGVKAGKFWRQAGNMRGMK